MRIGILSDTHDQVARTSRATTILAAAGAQALIHCGDITTPDVVEQCAGLPAYFVLGNNDYDEPGLKRAIRGIDGTFLGRGGILLLENRLIAVTHGDSTREVRKLLAESPDYLFLGHSHEAEDTREGPTRWINPGALHRATMYTVALLDLQTDELTMLTV